MELLKDLNWRYAVKKYSTEKVDEQKIDLILNAINLSASSCGLQPYRLFVISNEELKLKLKADSFNGQIAESSHLFVFAAYNKITTQNVQDLVYLTSQVKNVSIESLDGLFVSIDSFFRSRTDEQNRHWAEKQTYIALGTALVAAANLRVDATPMEGFDSELFDKLLGLDEKGLHSTVILSLGYRDEANDYLASTKKVRIPLEEMAHTVN
ncbi:NAD(P)H-dependent oxidoreductase [Chryseobacterium mulctrae]|uniref:NAD(P)H-dependent oxidoreductase n=1 Tax=Chryseobacterium mulctrae TaxID=2576777 RepID=UPI001117774A|nr:NAD(P)H-dependent oxidoreductase [Chryseobacterium mulctrae]